MLPGSRLILRRVFTATHGCLDPVKHAAFCRRGFLQLCALLPGLSFRVLFARVSPFWFPLPFDLRVSLWWLLLRASVASLCVQRVHQLRSGPHLQCLCECATPPFSSAFTVAVTFGNATMASTIGHQLDDSLATLQRDLFDAVTDLHARIDVVSSWASRAHQISQRIAFSIERLEFRIRVLEQIAENTDLIDPSSTEGYLHSLD